MPAVDLARPHKHLEVTVQVHVRRGGGAIHDLAAHQRPTGLRRWVGGDLQSRGPRSLVAGRIDRRHVVVVLLILGEPGVFVVGDSLDQRRVDRLERAGRVVGPVDVVAPEVGVEHGIPGEVDGRGLDPAVQRLGRGRRHHVEVMGPGLPVLVRQHQFKLLRDGGVDREDEAGLARDDRARGDVTPGVQAVGDGHLS